MEVVEGDGRDISASYAPAYLLTPPQQAQISQHSAPAVYSMQATSMQQPMQNNIQPNQVSHYAQAEGATSSSSCSDNVNANSVPVPQVNSGKRGNSDPIQNPNQSKKVITNSDTNYAIPTQNSFGILANLPDNDDSNPTDPTMPENIRIPPIHINNITNIIELNQEIKTQISAQFTVTFNNNKAKVNFQKIEDFRKAIQYFVKANKQFHTYKDPTNKKFSVVFKNIHPSITQEEIYNDLKEQYSSLNSVTRLHKNNEPIPVVAAEFSGQQSIESILRTTQICNLKVKVERRRKTKGIIQCLRCLDFGHTKNNCYNKISCIHCAENHYSVNCPSKNDPPKCRNCEGTHRADIRTNECQYFRKLSENKTRTSQNSTSNIRTSKPTSPPPHLHPRLKTPTTSLDSIELLTYQILPMNQLLIAHQITSRHTSQLTTHKTGSPKTF